MRIGSNGGVGFGTTPGAIEQTQRRLNSVLEKLATGQRVNRSKDDAAGLAISEGLISQTRGFKMATRNAEDAVSAYNIADGASNETTNILQRQRELATQSRNATLNDRDREALNKEFQQLNEEIERISGTTKFNKQDLANGQGLGDGTAELQVGPNEGETITSPQIDLSAQTLGMTGTDIGTAAGANAAIANIDNAINTINEQRSTIGAMTNRLESTIRNLQTADVNTTAAQSVIRDQDMAMGIAEMIKNQVLSQTGNSALSVFNRISADHILGLIK
jgi:flagellin